LRLLLVLSIAPLTFRPFGCDATSCLPQALPFPFYAPHTSPPVTEKRGASSRLKWLTSTSRGAALCCTSAHSAQARSSGPSTTSPPPPPPPPPPPLFSMHVCTFLSLCDLHVLFVARLVANKRSPAPVPPCSGRFQCLPCSARGTLFTGIPGATSGFANKMSAKAAEREKLEQLRVVIEDQLAALQVHLFSLRASMFWASLSVDCLLRTRAGRRKSDPKTTASPRKRRCGALSEHLSPSRSKQSDPGAWRIFR
jgi:hypothetical protein